MPTLVLLAVAPLRTCSEPERTVVETAEPPAEIAWMPPPDIMVVTATLPEERVTVPPLMIAPKMNPALINAEPPVEITAASISPPRP